MRTLRRGPGMPPLPQHYQTAAEAECISACLQRVEVQQELLVLGRRLADHVDQQVGDLRSTTEQGGGGCWTKCLEKVKRDARIRCLSCSMAAWADRVAC